MTPTASLNDRLIPLTAAEQQAMAAELQQLREEQQNEPSRAGQLPDPLDPAIAVRDRIVLLETALARAEVVQPGPNGYTVAALGTAVEVDDGRRKRVYRLVLDAGTDTAPAGAVSATSPVGAALLGQPVGTSVTIALPDGRSRSLNLLRIDAEG